MMKLKLSFDEAIMKRAKKIAAQYKILIEPSKELGFMGSSVEMPNVFAHGKTPALCVQSTQTALAVGVATMLENGLKPPLPASAERRTTQVNVRLSSMEKYTLTEAARQRGFKGIGDFMRNAALNSAQGV